MALWAGAQGDNALLQAFEERVLVRLFVLNEIRAKEGTVAAATNGKSPQEGGRNEGLEEGQGLRAAEHVLGGGAR